MVDEKFHANLKLRDEHVRVRLSLIGKFQWENALAAAASAYLSGVSAKEIAKALEDLPAVWGRLEIVARSKNGAQIFVDYAHTPDALQAALQALRAHLAHIKIHHGQGQLYCLFGCGGDRDSGKRKEMGAMVERYADHAIITDDNPRNEDAESIRLAVMQSCAGWNIGGRAQAIRAALRMLKAGDILLIAGKGHEDYQIVGETRLDFDDAACVKEVIAAENNKPPLWVGQELCRAAQGVFVTPDCDERDIYDIAIDSRKMRRGDLFIALKDKRDGHEFIPAAREKQASLIIAEQSHSAHAGDISVTSSLKSLEQIAAARRAESQALCIGVTGSLGKTSFRYGAERILRALQNSHASIGSFNNHIGLPLSLARMPKDSETAIFEMGMNHAGEIADLSRILRPDMAVITTIAPVHMAHFDSVEDIAHAKAEIFIEMQAGSLAILPFDNPHYPLLLQKAQERDLRILSFGTEAGADFQCISHDYDRVEETPASRFVIRHAKEEYPITSFTLAPHWGCLFASLLAAAHGAGIALFDAARALFGIHPFHGRGNLQKGTAEQGEVTLIDESYNASPVAMQTALRYFADCPLEGRRVAVLGSMLELGAGQAQYHKDLLDACLKADCVHLVGEAMADLHPLLPTQKRGFHEQDSTILADKLFQCLKAGDNVLIKGSAGMQMQKIVQRLTPSSIIKN